MANEPQDYDGALPESLAGKTSVTAANAQGMYEPAGISYSGVTHADNPDDVLVHACASTSATNPFPASIRIKTDTWRALQGQVQYLVGHLAGWRALGSRWGSGVLTPFVSEFWFELVSATGNRLRLRCKDAAGNLLDPREGSVWSGVVKPDIFEPYEGVSATGCLVNPWCLVSFVNSVYTGRVQSLVLKPDFSMMSPTATTSSEFEIECDQDLSHAGVALDDEKPVLVGIFGEYVNPPAWQELMDQYLAPMKEIERTFTPDDWGVGKVVRLKDYGGNDCRIAVPLLASDWRGTFYVFASASASGDDNFTNISASLAAGLGGDQWGWPRVRIIGRADSGLAYTELALGPIAGDTRDLTDGKLRIKVRYFVPVSSMGVADAFHPIERACAHSRRDYMQWVYSGTNIVARDKSPHGHHFYCERHKDIPSINATRYTWDCCQAGSCPLFAMKQLTRPDAFAVAQLTNNQDVLIQQSAPGENGAMAFTYYRPSGGTPSILWGLNPPTIYQSNYDAAYCARIGAQSGGYVMIDESAPYYTDEDDNQHIKLIEGGLWNVRADASGATWPSNRLGDSGELLGILARRMGDGFVPLTQLSEGRSNTTDPVHQLYTERLGRKIAAGYRDVYGGTAISFTARATPGIEGDGRVQRVRTLRKYVSGIDMDRPGNQGPGNFDRIEVRAAPSIVEGEPNVLAVVRLKTNGTGNYGIKRIGQMGINGQVWRAEELGGGLVRIHCAPGIWISTYIGGGPGERYTVDVPWYGSGNVVAYPPHWAPDGAVDNAINAKAHGSMAVKAVRGDSVSFPVAGIENRAFVIEDAIPGEGDDFSGESSTIHHLAATLAPFARADDLLVSGSPRITVTKVETPFTGSVLGTWHDITAYLQQARNADRPYYTDDALLGDPRTWLDMVELLNEDLRRPITQVYNGGAGNSYRTVIVFPTPHGLVPGDVINVTGTAAANGNHTVSSVYSTTIILTDRLHLATDSLGGEWIPVRAGYYVQIGSARIYPDPAIFGRMSLNIAGILLGGYNKLRVTYAADGVEQAPREVMLNTPQIRLDLPVAGAAITRMSVQHLRRDTGAWETMTYAGLAGSAFDLFLGLSTSSFKFWTDGAGDDRLLFAPALAGDQIVIEYETSTPVSLDGFGAPGVFWRDFQAHTLGDDAKRAQLKKCDVLVLRDNARGDLSGVVESLAGATFYVSTGAVIA